MDAVRSTSSFFNIEEKLSVMLLSQRTPARPLAARILRSVNSSRNSAEEYSLPCSEYQIAFGSSKVVAVAFQMASSTSLVHIFSAMDQPTSFLD